MKKDTAETIVFFGTIMIICGMALVIALTASPITYTVNGKITDWIGNDNGFGIKIDNQIYWLDYSGNFTSSVPFTEMVGYNCTLVYQKTSGMYLHTVSLTIYD